MAKIIRQSTNGVRAKDGFDFWRESAMPLVDAHHPASDTPFSAGRVLAAATLGTLGTSGAFSGAYGNSNGGGGGGGAGGSTTTIFGTPGNGGGGGAGLVFKAGGSVSVNAAVTGGAGGSGGTGIPIMVFPGLPGSSSNNGVGGTGGTGITGSDLAITLEQNVDQRRREWRFGCDHRKCHRVRRRNELAAAQWRRHRRQNRHR